MQKLKLLLSILLPLVMATGFPSRAEAADCTISPQSVAFGSYDPLSPAPLDGVGNVAISCSAPASFTISLGAGNGTVEQREMRSGLDAMQYNLYVDSARMLVWDDGMGPGNTVWDTTQSGNYAIYGRVPARQNLSAGTYADSIVVTITY